MKKLTLALTALTSVLLIVLTFNQNIQESFGLICTFGVLIMLACGYFHFERNSFGTKEIAMIGSLSAFTAVSRIVFAPIPNVKPVTFLVALSGYVFGPYEGFLIGSSAAFLSNIFFGQGPWTPWQMFCWGLVGVISGFLGKREKQMSCFKFSLLCFAYGFMFDWIMTIWHVLNFVKPLTVQSIIAAYLAGLTFDVLHASSSFIFSMIFYEAFLEVMGRYKSKLQVTYLK